MKSDDVNVAGICHKKGKVNAYSSEILCWNEYYVAINIVLNIEFKRFQYQPFYEFTRYRTLTLIHFTRVFKALP